VLTPIELLQVVLRIRPDDLRGLDEEQQADCGHVEHEGGEEQVRQSRRAIREGRSEKAGRGDRQALSGEEHGSGEARTVGCSRWA